MCTDRRRPRWPALLLTGLALHAGADARAHDTLTTRPAEGPQNLPGGWPYIPAEYAPPAKPSTADTPSRTDAFSPARDEPPPGSAPDKDLASLVSHAISRLFCARCVRV